MLTVEIFPHATEETRAIRTRVFIEEQAFVTPAEEFDAYDEGGVHVLVRWNGEPAGTGRMIAEEGAAPGMWKFGRIAVLPQYRKHPARVGANVLAALENEAKKLGVTGLYVSAQCQAQKFYERCGFAVTSGVYDEHGVSHVKMEKSVE